MNFVYIVVKSSVSIFNSKWINMDIVQSTFPNSPKFDKYDAESNDDW